MSFLPDDPFKALANIRQEFDRMFSTFPFHFFDNMFGSFGGLKVDVYETATEVIATCNMPGLKKDDDIQIHVDHNILNIRGSINTTTEVKKEDMFRQEHYMGGFQRTIFLPSPVDQNGVKATYKNDVLEIRMPKVAQHDRQNIDIDFY